jgi:hypothetical protein
VQLQLSWVKWLLPERLFRHGFDFRQQQRQQNFLQRRQQQQGRRLTDDTEQLQQALLQHGESDGAPEPANAPNAAPFGSSSNAAGAGEPSRVVVEVTAAGASDSSSRARSRSSSRRRGGRTAHSRSGSSIGGDGVGPPVVKDVWQEAVELLMSNGGDAKVGWEMHTF